MAILLMLASLPANLDQCTTAVRSAPPTAVVACAGPKEVDIMSADSPAPACLDALAAGQEVGKYAAAPMMRKGLTVEFEKKLALCKSPPPKDEIPVLKTTNVWD